MSLASVVASVSQSAVGVGVASALGVGVGLHCGVMSA
jgi:hypothetical protein